MGYKWVTKNLKFINFKSLHKAKLDDKVEPEDLVYDLKLELFYNVG